MAFKIIKSVFKPLYRPFRNRYENRLIEILSIVSEMRNKQKEQEEQYASLLRQYQKLEEELGFIRTYLKENLLTEIAEYINDTAG